MIQLCTEKVESPEPDGSSRCALSAAWESGWRPQHPKPLRQTNQIYLEWLGQTNVKRYFQFQYRIVLVAKKQMDDWIVSLMVLEHKTRAPKYMLLSHSLQLLSL